MCAAEGLAPAFPSGQRARGLQMHNSAVKLVFNYLTAFIRTCPECVQAPVLHPTSPTQTLRPSHVWKVKAQRSTAFWREERSCGPGPGSQSGHSAIGGDQAQPDAHTLKP